MSDEEAINAANAAMRLFDQLRAVGFTDTVALDLVRASMAVIVQEVLDYE
jgi:hypothetical protein